MKRFVSVAVGALLVLVLLAAVIPAFAAPDQGDGYWTDTFTDSTGINASASTNISVSGGDVKLALQGVPLVAFSDSFEGTSIDTSKWGNSGWTTANDQQHDGSRSAKATKAGIATIRILTSNDIDLSDATSVTLDFWYRKYTTIAGGTTLTLSYYDGSSWQLITTLTSSNNVWAHFNQAIPLPTYQRSDFKIRFEANVGWSQSFWIDQLSISKTMSGYCSSGSLTSIDISPSNLQSWETFTASDDNPWPYKKPVTITNAGTALTDYQTSITVSYVSGKMNSDFSDLRFKDGSGNILSYWIESYTASSTAKVWVKVPSIAAGGTTTIYMYYGNAQASSTSSESAVFDYVDRGNQISSWSTSVTSGQSTTEGDPAPSYYANSSRGSYMSRNINLVPGKIVTFNIKSNGLGNFYFLTNSSGSGQMYRLDTRGGANYSGFATATNWTLWTAPGSGFYATANQWYKLTLVITSATSATLYYNQTADSSPSGFGTLLGTYTITNRGGYIGLVGDALGPAYKTLWDNIIVRKYAATEPTVTLGNEETVSIAYQILRASDNAVLCTISAAQAAAGYDISSCAGTTGAIKLRANMVSTNISLTPVLHDWQVTYIPNYNLIISAGSGGTVINPGTGTYTYGRGTVVDIVATADPCYTFSHWSGNTGTIANPSSASTTITMNSNCSIQANFNIITYTLSVSGNNSGGSPYFDGTSPFDCNTIAVIHANTSSCAIFAGWSGAGIEDPNAENTNVSMTQDRTVTANYVIKTYALSYSAGPNGTLGGTTFQTVNCGTSGSAVTAVPNDCYHFVNWSDASTANPRIDTNVHTNIAVMANFAINTSTLSLTANNSGGSPRFDGTSPFNCGANVNIYANTTSCYIFAGWTPADGIDNPSAENTTVLMNVSRSLTASYIVKTFTLSVSANNSLGGSPYFEGANPLACGTSVPIHANVSPCYTFAGWTPTAGVANPSAENTTVVITADTELTAKYTLNTYRLNVSANNSGGTPTIDGTNPFTCGANVSIHANTKPDYTFAGWNPTEGIDDPSADNTYVSMTQNRSLTASYTPVPHTIDITAPTDITSWMLNIGSNTNSGNLAINVFPNTANWSVTAGDSDTTTGGYMTSWNGTVYNPLIKLINAMRLQGPDREVTLPNTGETAIAHGTGDYPGITITFRQEVTWNDEPGTYQIVVTFIGTVY